MKFARRAKAEADINMTPLIDVVFLLLIFFVVSTTFTRETHLSIDLPESTGLPLEISPKQIMISISKSGQYAINGVVLINHSIATLRSAIEKTSNGDSSVPMVIMADAKTPHQAVVTAMDVVGQLGFSQLSISTQNMQPENQ